MLNPKACENKQLGPPFKDAIECTFYQLLSSHDILRELITSTHHIHNIILLSPPPDLLYEIVSAFDSFIIVYQY